MKKIIHQKRKDPGGIPREMCRRTELAKRDEQKSCYGDSQHQYAHIFPQ